MAGNHTLGTIRGTIEIDYDGTGIVKAIKDTDRLSSTNDRLGQSSSRVLSMFGKMSGVAFKAGAAASSLNSGLGLVAGTLAVIGPLAAAGFAALPAIIAAYASVMIIAKVATAGVGDALKSAGEGGKAFEESLKKLSPEARKFVLEYQKAIPALGRVQQAMQDAFFTGAQSRVAGVVSAISSLRPQAVGVSSALGQIVQNIVRFATSGKSVEGIRTILSGVNAFLLKIKNSIGPVVQAFIGLAAQASVFGGQVGGSLNGALAKLAAWLNSIDVAELFETAAPIVKSLGAFFEDIAVIAKQLFSIFNTDGAEAASLLSELASKLADFLQSAQGQAALTALGQAFSAISGAAGQIFLALLEALAPAIVALAPGVAELAGQVAGLLVPAITTLNPLLTSLAGFLSDNMGWIGPLAGVVVALAGAYKVYAAGVKAVIALKALELGAHLKSVGAWIASTAATVGNTAATAANAAVRAGAFVGSFIASTAAMAASTAGMIAQKVAMIAGVVATKAVAAAQWLLNAAMSANPIGAVVAVIIALVAGLIYAYKNSETFRNIVNAVWASIKVAVAAVVNWFVNTALPFLSKVWKGIVSGVKAMVSFAITQFNIWRSAIRTVLNVIKAIFSAVWKGITTVVRTHINLVRTVITTGINAAKAVWTAVMNSVRAVTRAVWSAISAVVQSHINRVKSVIAGVRAVIAIIRSAFNSARSAAASALNSLVSLVRGLPRRVSSALGNIGRLLYSKGKSLVQGFINGILGMLGSVRNAGSRVVGAISDFLPGSPAKEGPLSGKGYALLRAQRMMGDIAKGINMRSSLPAKAMAGAVNPIARAIVPGGSGTSSAAATAPTTQPVGTFGPYNLTVDGEVLTSFVVDTITGNPVVVSRASDEGKRKKSWAGSGRS